MRSLFLTIGLLFASAVSAQEEVVAGLSQNRVSITANFDGSEILIFGAVKRETPIPTETPLDVIITVSGPSTPVMVRRKSNRAGIWVNTDAVEVDSAPSFYAVATTGPLKTILSSTEDLRHKVSINRAIRSVGAPASITDSARFTEALIRIRRENGLYQHLEGKVALADDTLFRTSIALPANLTEGTYLTRFMLLRDREVINSYETQIQVQKVGLERWLYNLAYETPLVYGLLSLFIAILAGWGASAVFGYKRS
ncbi:TIGR02186 family protein [Falsihalocynthiibacter sp. SS001]|uniref:TIGR02186 family protein n=1 Tax=Falsihalocynthiibacter sp. SS001 TaxID=3349698 RepID=UPI0036D26EC9